MAELAVTTPRCERVGGLARPGGGGGHRGHVADAPQQVDQLLHVPHEVATRELLVLEHRRQPVTGRPGVGQVHEAGIRRAGGGEAGGLLVGGQVVGEPAQLEEPRAHGRRREPRVRWSIAAAVLVGEARHEGGERRDVEVVEQPAGHRLGDEEIGLVVRAGEHLTGRRERPAVEVAPRLEEPQDPVEPTGQRAGATLHLALQVVELARDALGLHRAADVRLAVGAVGDRVGLGGDEGLVDLGGSSTSSTGTPWRLIRARRSASPTWCWKARLFGL